MGTCSAPTCGRAASKPLVRNALVDPARLLGATDGGRCAFEGSRVHEGLNSIAGQLVTARFISKPGVRRADLRFSGLILDGAERDTSQADHPCQRGASKRISRLRVATSRS